MAPESIGIKWVNEEFNSEGAIFFSRKAFTTRDVLLLYLMTLKISKMFLHFQIVFRGNVSTLFKVRRSIHNLKKMFLMVLTFTK